MAAIGRFELFKSLKNTPGVRPLSDHKAAFQQAQIPATRINGIGQLQSLMRRFTLISEKYIVTELCLDEFGVNSSVGLDKRPTATL